MVNKEEIRVSLKYFLGRYKQTLPLIEPGRTRQTARVREEQSSRMYLKNKRKNLNAWKSKRGFFVVVVCFISVQMDREKSDYICS